LRVLGIDPGLRLTGYGCIEGDAPAAAVCSARLVEAGVIRLGRSGGASTARETPGAEGGREVIASAMAAPPSRRVAGIEDRLLELDRDLRELLDRCQPDLVCVEELFSHYKRPQTAVIMAHARGVILLAIRSAGIPLAQYKPTMVKKSLTGSGHASKEQMQRAIQMRFNLPEPPSPPDVADALAIALCGMWRAGMMNDEC
jgi:crossover junction endodeoxyribonuclease RuvC